LKYFILLTLFLFFLIPCIGHSVMLQRTGKFISLTEESEISGLGSGMLVVTDSKSLTCYNKRLKQIFSRELSPDEKPVIANDGSFWGISRKSELDGFGDELNKIEIFNHKGKACWNLDGIIDGDTYLSPTGDYVVVIKGTRGHADTEMFIFHRDSVGIRLYIRDCSELMFSGDGSRFFINSDGDGLKMFDYTGRLLSNYGFQQGCAFSENSELSACFSQSIVSVIKDTTVVSKMDIGEIQFRTMIISDSVDRVFCCAGHRLIVIDYENNRQDWEYRLETAAENFLTVDISDDARFIALGLNYNLGMMVKKENRYQEGYLYFFNVGGETMLQERFSFPDYTPGTPRVAFWPDGRSIMVHTFGRIDVIEMR